MDEPKEKKKCNRKVISMSKSLHNIFKNVEKDTPYNTFISSAPFEPSLWFTLHKSLLIRSLASALNLASSGNFK